MPAGVVGSFVGSSIAVGKAKSRRMSAWSIIMPNPGPADGMTRVSGPAASEQHRQQLRVLARGDVAQHGVAAVQQGADAAGLEVRG